MNMTRDLSSASRVFLFEVCSNREDNTIDDLVTTLMCLPVSKII